MWHVRIGPLNHDDHVTVRPTGPIQGVWAPEWVGIDFVTYHDGALGDNVGFSVLWDDHGEVIRHIIDFQRLTLVGDVVATADAPEGGDALPQPLPPLQPGAADTAADAADAAVGGTDDDADLTAANAETTGEHHHHHYHHHHDHSQPARALPAPHDHHHPPTRPWSAGPPRGGVPPQDRQGQAQEAQASADPREAASAYTRERALGASGGSGEHSPEAEGADVAFRVIG